MCTSIHLLYGHTSAGPLKCKKSQNMYVHIYKKLNVGVIFHQFVHRKEKQLKSNPTEQAWGW